MTISEIKTEEATAVEESQKVSENTNIAKQNVEENIIENV